MIFELIHAHWVAAKILMTVFCVTGIALCCWKKLYGVLSFFVFGLIINTMSIFGLGIRHEWIRLLLCFIVLLAIILSGDAVRILSAGSKKNYRTPPSPQIEQGPKGVPTSYDSMDKISDGWQPGNLIVIGACPGVDKTAMILNLVANVALREDVPVAVFSIEKTSGEIVQRLLEMETGLSVKDAQNMTSDDKQKLERGLTSLAKSKIYIDDTPVISISEFKAKASQLVRVKGVRSIFVDYLHPDVPEVSRLLKETAKELNVPIIALAQLNRQVPQR